MYQIPNSIPDPASCGAAFMSDATFGFAAWLAVAGIAYLALLPLALCRRRVVQIETGSGSIELPKAA